MREPWLNVLVEGVGFEVGFEVAFEVGFGVGVRFEVGCWRIAEWVLLSFWAIPSGATEALREYA